VGLRQIRLLKVKPALYRDDYVDSDLIICRLDEAPVYAALSYCWGSEGANRIVICNGKAFEARESLEGALKRYRASGHLRKQPGCLRRIWAHEISFFVRIPELG